MDNYFDLLNNWKLFIIEELEFVRRKRVHTLRFVEKIIEEVLNSDIKNVAKRNNLSEPEIETMLKDLGQDLIEEKPVNLKKLGIDDANSILV